MRRDLATLSIAGVPLTWQNIETGCDGRTGWQHSGIAVHPEGRDLIRISGTVETARIHTELTEMHCLTVASNDGEIWVWAADNGHRYVHDSPAYGEIRRPGRVVALRLDGTLAAELAQPDVFGPWSPTSVALTDPQDPASDIWVADGYGQSLIHRTDETGQTVAPDGVDGIFNSPHGITAHDDALYLTEWMIGGRVLRLSHAG